MAKGSGSTHCQGLPAVFMPFPFPEDRKNGTVFSITKKTRRKAASGSVLSFSYALPCTLYHGQNIYFPFKNSSVQPVILHG
ncbi:hypothetical protein BLA28_15810 [Eisenbergiella tayi]|nr:hypothetical protein BLA28_15810 [Eisenbergiella tayi]